MGKVNRTANCSKCGGVLLKIKPSSGCIYYYCAECNEDISRVNYDKYETVLPTCEKCGNDTFKARITVDEEDNLHEYWEPECVSCKSSPKSIYVDNEGKVINEDERLDLLLKDRIKELEEEIETQNDTINQLKNELSNLNDEIEEKERCIYDLEEELDNAKNRISKLEYEVSDLEWEIHKLED